MEKPLFKLRRVRKSSIEPTEVSVSRSGRMGYIAIHVDLLRAAGINPDAEQEFVEILYNEDIVVIKKASLKTREDEKFRITWWSPMFRKINLANRYLNVLGLEKGKYSAKVDDDKIIINKRQKTA